MIIVTRDTLLNPSILEVRQLPRRFVERVSVWPRGPGWGLLLRLLIEIQWIRFSLWLLPLVGIALVWPGTALPLAQAPIPMLILIGLIELRVLRISAARRAELDRDAAARVHDLLRAQGRAALTQFAAGRQLTRGEVRLVVEQSPLRFVAPLTYVSLQAEDPARVLDLTPEERDDLRAALFTDGLTERALHDANTAENVFLQEVTLDAGSLSAHARLAAALRGPAPV